jgi:flagellin-like hook-associated protein FlgL
MTLSFVNSINSYYSIMGDSYLAQTNRIFKLVTGKLPNDYNYDRIMDGSFIYHANETTMAGTVNMLYRQLQEVQSALGAMEQAYEGLEMVSTRLNIIDGLAEYYQENPDITDVKRENINEQINYTLAEIQNLASSTRYNNVPLLDGQLETAGLYLNLVGNNSIDITDAFRSVIPEDIGLPYPGEVYLYEDNVEDLREMVVDAQNRIDTQYNDINQYKEHLEKAFENIGAAVYSTTVFQTLNTISNLFPYNESETINNSLFLTMGNISQSVRVDNTYYERIMGLLN